MLRTTLIATLLSTSLLGTACTDDMTADDPAAEGDGKADGWGSAFEHKVLEVTAEPNNVLQDAAYIYFSAFTDEDAANDPQTHSIMRMRRLDGTLDKLATVQGGVYEATLGGNFIYYTDRDTIYALAKTGGQPQVVAMTGGAVALAADANAVYAAIPAVENEKYVQRISRIALGTSTEVELARATYVTSLGIDDANVYWLDETLPNPAIGCGHNAGFAHKVSKLGGVDITLVAGINCPVALAVDSGASVYYTAWDQGGTSTLSKVSKLGGFPIPLGTNGGMALTTDPAAVFWISGTGDLMRQSKTFGIPRVVAHTVRDVVPGADAMGMYFWREQVSPRSYSLYRLGF